MRTIDTSTTGTIAEFIAAKACVRAGWKIAYPYGTDTPFDFLLYNEGEVRSVQVKGAQYEREEGQGTTRMVTLDKYQNIDFLICVNVLTEDLYIWRIDELPSTRLRFTLTPERNPEAFNAFYKLV
jgi:hypothetical protein